MTEAEWLISIDPQPMWLYLRRNERNYRKLRLLACACLRRIWHLLIDERCRKAVEVAERAAEGLASHEDVLAALKSGQDGWRAQAEAAKDGKYSTPFLRAMSDAGLAAYHVIDADWQSIGNAADAAAYFAAPLDHPVWATAKCHETRIQVTLTKCIFGNPFRPVFLASTVLEWHDGIIPTFAQRIYDEHAFDRLPFLADALEKAGCNDGELLAHCRGAGPHVRGCWPVDVILGTS